jgi:pyruvate formate lyase activating enzyme
MLSNDMESGMVFDIRRFSIHDGPGIRTTVFLKGCPLSCWWCHNPESQQPEQEVMFHPNRCLRCGACQAACPNDAISRQEEMFLTNPALCQRCGACVTACPAQARELVGKPMSVPEVMAQIERDIPFFDESGGGVTVSGGEPLMQPRFLQALLTACKQLDLHTVLDTCGYASWKTIEEVRPFVDLFLYDIKLIDNQQHIRYTGAPNTQILSNLQKLAKSGAQIILRAPLIPGINDGEEQLNQVAALARSLPGVQHLDLLAYHYAGAGKYDRLSLGYRLAHVTPPDAERMEQIARFFRQNGLQVKIGG